MSILEKRYVILRQSGILKPPANIAEPYLGSFRVAPETKVHSLTLETPSLDLQELDKVHNQPDVASIAPEMPVNLIEPVNRDSGSATVRAGGVAWGISAIKADISTQTGNGIVVAILDTGTTAVTQPLGALTSSKKILQVRATATETVTVPTVPERFLVAT